MKPTPPPAVLPAEEGPPNIWNAFGLSSDPFFQEELRPGPTALYPVSLHVGREQELRILLRQLGGGPSTRAVIEGAPGLGKTSLANKLKAEVAGHLLTHPDPVRITAESTILSFTADVLRIILRIRAARGLETDDFWRRTARIVEGEDTMGAGVTVGPVGVQYQSGRIPAEAPIGTLYETLEEALRRMWDETSARLLVHVNNLENLGEADAARAANLLRDVRDMLLLPGAHWVFVGASGVERQVFRRHDQVGGIIPAALVLEPLRPAEVAELLERRYAYLATGAAPPVPPVEPETAARLYELYLGDLRNFLRLLGDACTLELGIEGIQPLTAERVIHATAPRYARAIERLIGTADTGYLSRLIQNTGGEFTVGDATRATGLSQSAASRLVARLREEELILQTRTDGKRVFYRPSGQVAVAFRGPEPGPPATEP